MPTRPFKFLYPTTETFSLGMIPTQISRNTGLRMRDIIKKSAVNEYVRKWAEHITQDIIDRDEHGEIEAIFKFLQSKTRYVHDPRGHEYTQTPPYILKQIEVGTKPGLDCFAVDQKIIVKHKSKGIYDLKEVGNLADCYRNYDALSYDFKRQEFVFKPITRWLDKGTKEVFLVKLKNGNSFKVTEEHDIICLTGENGKFIDQKIPLKDIDLEDYRQNRLPIAKQIPILNTQPGKSLDELWLEGLFVGDGCSSQNICSIAADDKKIQKEIIRILKELDLTWKIYTKENSSHTGGDYFVIHKAPYSKYLVDNFGGRATTKQFPYDYLSLNLKQIKALLAGYDTADGYRPERGQWLGKLRTMYTTISEILAEQLIFLHLLAGRPLYTYYQDINHIRTLNIKKLYSKYSTYRLYDRIVSGKFKYSRGGEIFPNLTSTKIKSITSLGKQEVCDITVQDTHNVVLNHGLIIGQCDDYATLGLSLARSLGYNTKIRIVSFRKNGAYSHVFGLVQIRGKWTPFDAVRKDETLGWMAPGITRILDISV